MSTKDHHRFFFKDKRDLVVSEKYNGKYNNLNLNQNNQCYAKTVQPFNNFTNQNKKTSNYVLTTSKDFFQKNDSQTKQTSFGKSKLTSSIVNPNIQKDFGKKEEGKILNAKRSTLSLHITAYESSMVATSDNPIDGAKAEIVKKKENASSIKKWKAVKELFNGSSSFVKYAFELPRQNRNQNNDPEVMQFKASQRLSNVNQPSPAVFGSYSAATNLNPQRPPPSSANSAPSSSNRQPQPLNMTHVFDGNLSFGATPPASGIRALRHPMAILAHVGFRGAAIFMYVFGNWFFSSFITQFLVIDQSRFDPFERSIFWFGLVVAPIFWALLVCLAFGTFSWTWMIIAIMGASMTFANLYGYLRCRWNSTNLFKNYFTTGAIFNMLSLSAQQQHGPALFA